MKDIIVKIQKSILSSRNPTMLIYDKYREVYGELPLTAEVDSLLCGEMKAYFLVDVDGQGMVRIKKRVENQNW